MEFTSEDKNGIVYTVTDEIAIKFATYTIGKLEHDYNKEAFDKPNKDK